MKQAHDELYSTVDQKPSVCNTLGVENVVSHFYFEGKKKLHASSLAAFVFSAVFWISMSTFYSSGNIEDSSSRVSG